MSLKKFGTNDIIINTMKAHPQSEFFIYDGGIYYNNIPARSGSFNGTAVTSVSGGHGYISLYEYNIDKSSGVGTPITDIDGDSISRGGNLFIRPFITKDSAGASFTTVGATAYANEFSYGDTMYGQLPMSASIVREYMKDTAGKLIKIYDANTGDDLDLTECDDSTQKCETHGELKYRHYWAMKNRLNFLGARSKHYRVTGSATGDTYEWIKDQQVINMLSVPSIFYGRRIYPGTVSLRWYMTGSLLGEVKDIKQNGELIQVTSERDLGNDSNLPDNSGSVAGVVLYEEGLILLTGSWDLTSEQVAIIKDDATTYKPKWIYFGAGANDGVTQATTAATYSSASFGASFQGETDTQVVTMFTNARRGEVNYSNNPTFLQYGQNLVAHSSSQIYEENSSRLIQNVVSSSYAHQSASFERQVYISRIGIYDSSKNLIGVATLANPVLKKEDEDLTFKLRLDI